MKKFLFTILACFSVFMIAGCSDSDDDSASFPDELLGTYNVTFFGTQVINPREPAEGTETGIQFADLLYVSNDCAKAEELYPDVVNQNDKNQCRESSRILDGTVVVSKTDDGKLAITSRIQMEGGNIEQSKSDKYQYTEYNPTSDFKGLSGKGVRGWNYDETNNKPSAESTEFPESPYKIVKDGDLYRIDMTLVGKKVKMVAMGFMPLDMTVDAKTTVIMEKVSSDTTKPENAIQKPFTQE